MGRRPHSRAPRRDRSTGPRDAARRPASPPPLDRDRALRSATLNLDQLYALLVSAAERRRSSPLARQTDAMRLFHGAADGVDGLAIEQFGRLLIAQLHEQKLGVPDPVLTEACQRLMHHCGATSVYLKRFVVDRSAPPARLMALHSEAQPWLGEPAPEAITVCERDTRFLVRPFDGFSVGLFLEHRDNRLRVRERSGRRRVLNTFAYTCGYSVVAALGGAASTVSVDVSKKHLEWGKSNFAANGVPLEQHRFICSDVFDYFRRAVRQGLQFDLLILDPPTFSRAKQSGRTFEIDRNLGELVAGAVSLAAPGAQMLICTNHRGTSATQLERALRAALGGRGLEEVSRPQLPDDFPDDPQFAASLWAALS